MVQPVREYKLITEKFIEKLVEDLNTYGADGWSIAMYNQEFGVTKVVLERFVIKEEEA